MKSNWRERFEQEFGAFAILGSAGRFYNGAFANEARIRKALDFIEQELLTQRKAIGEEDPCVCKEVCPDCGKEHCEHCGCGKYSEKQRTGEDGVRRITGYFGHDMVTGKCIVDIPDKSSPKQDEEIEMPDTLYVGYHNFETDLNVIFQPAVRKWMADVTSAINKLQRGE